MAANSSRHPSLKPSHPGELLREIVVPATGKSKSEIARLLGVSRQTLHEILSEKQPVTPSMALRLGKLFGDGPGVWLRMQGEHDLWQAARQVDLSTIPTIEAA